MSLICGVIWRAQAENPLALERSSFSLRWKYWTLHDANLGGLSFVLLSIASGVYSGGGRLFGQSWKGWGKYSKVRRSFGTGHGEGDMF